MAASSRFRTVPRAHPCPTDRVLYRTRASWRCAFAVLAVGVVTLWSRAADATPETNRVSVNEAGTEGGNQESRHGVISPNGRYVAFESQSDNLTSNDGEGSSFDVYLRDVRDGTTALVSVNRFGTDAGNGASLEPAVSDNGRYVAFASSASDLVENDGNDSNDVFVRDLTTGVTTLVSVNHDGTASAAGGSGTPSISANGRYVAFESFASDLVSNDGNGTGDVFVRDVQAGVTTLVSVNRQGTASGEGRSQDPVMTPSGRYVAFVSVANDLVADDDNTANDVFLRDVNQSKTTLVSVSRSGIGGGKGDSSAPIVSPNGRHVAFSSVARDIVTGDRNGSADVFVRDLRKETTTVVSVNKTGKRTGNGDSYALSVTPSGRYVVFSSNAKNLVADAGDRNDSVDIFVRDLRALTTQLVSINAAGNVSGNDGSDAASISADGRYVLFSSHATNLVAEPTGGSGDIFLRDLVDHTTSLVSINAAGTAGGDAWSAGPRLTPDGRNATFESAAGDLVTNDANGDHDVFRRVLQ